MKAAIRLAVTGFLVVLLGCMLFLKPYLPKAILYNFAGIEDYELFPNRIVAVGQVQPWATDTAIKINLPSDLDALLTDTKTTAVVVIQNGKIVFERYSLDGAENKISGSFSMAKTIVALLTGIAIDQGSIASVQDPMELYLPEFKNRPEGKITIEQLLQMSSGLNWDESYFNPFSITTESYYGFDLYRTALKQRVVTDPGKTFSYQSGTTLLLGMVVTRATKRTLAVYASENLWKPLGASQEALWSMDHEEGLEKAFCCFNSTARDFARLGQLMLNEGEWNHQKIISKDWIKKMITPHGLPDETGVATDYYGYQTWIRQTPQGPISYFQGILGQYIMMIPQKNAVVVRLGHTKGKKMGQTYEENIRLMDWVLSDL
jgi:CubicO group peptidase (beta-lactamase class C family)